MTHKSYLHSERLCLSEAEIVTAALMAYYQNEGRTKTVSFSSVYYLLGIDRHSREWDTRGKIVSSQKLSYLLKKAGFIPVSNRNSRGKRALYTLPEGLA